MEYDNVYDNDKKYVDYNIFLMRFTNETCHCWVLQMADTKIFIILHLLYEKGLNKLSISFNFAQISISLWFCWSHLSHWAWNKGYNRYSSVCFIPWQTHQIWQWVSVKNETLRQQRWYNFPIVNFSLICSNIPVLPAYGIYISLSWSDIPELVWIPLWYIRTLI